jgi:hypothetical protein
VYAKLADQPIRGVGLVGGDQDLLGPGRLGIVEEVESAAAGVRDRGATGSVKNESYQYQVPSPKKFPLLAITPS